MRTPRLSWSGFFMVLRCRQTFTSEYEPAATSIREEMRREYGTVEIAVDLVRETRDEECMLTEPEF
jgi:hypothetical protein